MAFKSQAQRNKVLEMVKKGQITQEQFDAWDKDTPKKIPARIHKKKTEKKK